MKTSSITKVLNKMQIEISKNRNGQYFAKGPKYIVSWYEQLGNAHCVNIRKHNDEHDSQTDYCAGFFARTLKDISDYLQKY